MSTELQNGLRTYRPPLDQYTYCSEKTGRAIENWVAGVRDKTATRCLLLTGQTGLGKTTLALALSEALGVSPRDIRQVNCGDLRTLEDARDLINSSLMFGPSQGQYRVLILDECHQMVPNAQRAFLTPLEQLDQQILVICATSNPEMLQVPFRGRFYEIRLEYYSEDALVDILLALPNPPSPADAVTAARAARGNPRAAIGMIEKGVTEADAEEIKAEAFRIEDFIRAVATGNPEKALLCASALKPDQTVRFVQETCAMIETAWLLKMGATPAMPTQLKTFIESLKATNLDSARGSSFIWGTRDMAWLHGELQKRAFAHPNEFKTLVLGYFEQSHNRIQ